MFREANKIHSLLLSSFFKESNDDARVIRVRYVLNVFLIAFFLIELNNYSANQDYSLSDLFILAFFYLFFSFYNTRDTSNIVAAMLSWTITIFATYVAWKNDGLYDISLYIFPCILIFSSIIAGKATVYFLVFFMIVIFYLFSYANYIGFMEKPIKYSESIWWYANNLSIMLVVYLISINIVIMYIKTLILSLSKKKRHNKEIEKKAESLISFDRLTKLPNDHLCEKQLPAIIQNNIETNNLIAFLTLDLDNFKWINSSFGHAIGDEIICHLSERLSRLTNNNIILFRSAGNEFIFIMVADDYDEISEYANQLLQAVARPFKEENYDIEISSKVGISVAPVDGVKHKTLKQKSQLALAYAKEGTSNSFQFYDIEMENYAKKRLRMINDLKTAIEQEEFELYYQPKIDINSKKVVGAEALIRWNKTNTGIISPAEFIPVAEESGLIIEIGKWAIEKACYDCKRWHIKGYPDINVAVNLSPLQFKRGNLLNIVSHSLKRVDLEPKYLELEITESLFIEDSQFVKQQLKQITRYGVSIAIDDFGTGYSNLNYLNNFNASTLKIDMSFILNMHHSKTQQDIVQAIIQMSNIMQLQNVAEGVEDEATLLQLKKYGCQLGQGYFWSKPLPCKEFLHWLQDYNSQNKQ